LEQKQKKKMEDRVIRPNHREGWKAKKGEGRGGSPKLFSRDAIKPGKETGLKPAPLNLNEKREKRGGKARTNGVTDLKNLYARLRTRGEIAGKRKRSSRQIDTASRTQK